MEQMCLTGIVSEERRAFEILYPRIQDIILNATEDSGVLIFRELGNCSSVYFLDTNEIFFKIRIRKKSRYILIPEAFVDTLPRDTVISKIASDSGMIRIPIEASEDVLTYLPAFRAMLERICRRHRTFGCCGRYEQCSNEKTCVHPDPVFALKCWYRCNLLEGKIFYGDNKTVT